MNRGSQSDLSIDSDDENVAAVVDSGPTPRSLLRGLTSKASSMAGTLSKGVLVAQQWTKEKLGTSKTSNEIDSDLSQQIDVVHEIANQAKAIEKALAHSIQAEHAALLQHEQLAQLITKAAVVHEATQKQPVSANPVTDEITTSNLSDQSTSHPSDPSTSQSTSSVTMAAGFPPDAVNKARNLALDLTQFHPYMRRLLAVRMQVCDEKSIFLGHLQSLISATVKPALSALQQLEIDRLHHDACQSKVDQMTSVTYSFNSPADETEYASSLKNAREKADTAHAKLERSKVMVTEHASHLIQRFHSTIERGINQYMIVELEHWMQSLQLLSKMKKGESIAIKSDSTSPVLKYVPVTVPISPLVTSTHPPIEEDMFEEGLQESVGRPEAEDEVESADLVIEAAPADL